MNVTGGKSAKRLVFGFMLTAAILSMWISNSATTLMLLPITLAVLQHVKDPKLTIAMLLGIAYAASLGGVGTPVGTPPNIIFMSVYHHCCELCDFVLKLGGYGQSSPSRKQL